MEERTAELRHLNGLLTVILESLGQGFTIFGKDGRCLEVYSKACLEILECAPAGKPIEEVLRVEDHEGFAVWMQSLFEEIVPFEDMKDLGPTQL